MNERGRELVCSPSGHGVIPAGHLRSAPSALTSCMSKLTIASFNEPEQAAHLCRRLEQAGIHAEVYDESKLQKYWFMSTPLAANKTRVDERDFEAAKNLLAGLDAVEDALHDAVRCPQCKSSRVEYPQFTRKFITPTFVEIFCLLRLMDKRFYCEECHFTWTAKPETPPSPWDGTKELDSLGWPKEQSGKDAPPDEQRQAAA